MLSNGNKSILYCVFIGNSFFIFLKTDPVVLTLDVLRPPVLEWETFEQLVQNDAELVKEGEAPNAFQFLDFVDDECTICSNWVHVFRDDNNGNSRSNSHHNHDPFYSMTTPCGHTFHKKCWAEWKERKVGNYIN
jgi:hypothetical protein